MSEMKYDPSMFCAYKRQFRRNDPWFYYATDILLGTPAFSRGLPQAFDCDTMLVTDLPAYPPGPLCGTFRLHPLS